MTLREQVLDALTRGYMESGVSADDDEAREAQTDAVLVVFAERERLLRERIERLESCTGGGPTLGGVLVNRQAVLGVFDDES